MKKVRNSKGLRPKVASSADPAGPTPKRGVGGSNPLMDASEQRRKPLFSRVFGFSYIKSYEKALSLYEIKFYSKI